MVLDKQGISKLSSCSDEKINTQLLVIERDCLSHFDEYLDRLDIKGKVAAVYDTNTYFAKGLKRIKADYEVILNSESLHANEKAIAYLMEKLPTSADIVAAVGSGTLHDIVRYCAAKRDLVFISCPTAASVDGFTSNVSALTMEGAKKTLSAVAPIIVLADLDVIKNAPLRLAKSGIGDMMGKYVSLVDWQIGRLLTGELYNDTVAKLVMEAVELVKKSAVKVISGNEKAYEALMYGLLLSGIAMQLIGNSRPASGAEHHISHLLEIAPEHFGVSKQTYHGERVGVGTLLISESYHKLVKKSTKVEFHLYPPHAEALQECFGEIAATIQEENSNDCLTTVEGEAIKAHWHEIRKLVAAIPLKEQLLTLYGKLGLMSSLEDLGVEESKKEDILRFSPFCRNRLTLQRIAVESNIV